MSDYLTKAGQGFYDIAIAATGVADNAVEIAAANGMSVTDAIPTGVAIVVPDNLARDVRVTNFYMAYAHPATDSTLWPGDPIEQGGIGRMAIGTTFIMD